MLRTQPTGRRRAVALASLAALVASLVGAPSAASGVRVQRPAQDPPSEGSAELKAEYDEVLGAEAELLQQLADVQAAKDVATTELATLATETTNMQLQLLDASAALTAAEDLAVLRTQERKEAEARVEAAQERLRKQIVAAYVSGGTDDAVLQAILNAENGEEAGQIVTYGKAVADGTQRLVEELDAARAERQLASEQAKEAEAAAETHRDDVSTATTFLATARDAKADLVAEQNLQILSETATLQEIQSRKVLVESRINSLNRASDGVQEVLANLQRGQPDYVPGAFTIDNPIPGVLPGSKFGLRHHPILNIDRLHAGCDMGAGTGTEIHAAADGFVVIAGERGGYGNTVVIDHGDSLATLYGHQSRLFVAPGDTVKRGDVIGLVGSTGLSTGPHLHFETRIKGAPVDPEGIIDFARPVDYTEPDATLTPGEGD